MADSSSWNSVIVPAGCPLIVRHFQKHWPKVKLRLAPAATGSSIRCLLEGQLELAISDQPVSHPGPYRHFPLFEDDLVVELSAMHSRARRPSVQLPELAEETLFHYSPPAECRARGRFSPTRGWPLRSSKPAFD